MIEFNLKDHVGKTIYLKPTGNNARRNSEHRVAVLKKVSRVYCEIEFEGWGRNSKIRFEGDRLDEGCNSGYIVHLSEQSFLDERNKMDIARIIFDKYRYASDYQSVSLESLVKVADILELDISFVERSKQ